MESRQQGPSLGDWGICLRPRANEGPQHFGCSCANSGNTNCSAFALFSVKIGRSRQVQLGGYTGIDADLGDFLGCNLLGMCEVRPTVPFPLGFLHLGSRPTDEPRLSQ